MENQKEIEIDNNKNGKLSVSPNVVQKLIYRLLTSENYQVALNNINIINKEKTDLEAQIQILVNKTSNLIDLKENIIKLILKRINAVLNINISNINIIFSSK